ncbi:MAG: ribonuclease D [Myxococcota bacterium]|jgi:ribonuclease D
MTKLEISKTEVNLLPLWRYEGEVIQPTTDAGFAEAAARLAAATVIGIDTETRPTFRKGVPARPVALIQLALPDVVYLIRLNNHGLPDGIRAVLGDASIKKIGIGTRDDVRELKRDFNCELRGVVDLNSLCKGLGYKSIGARKLTALILGKRISKSQQTSNWENPELTRAQVGYAATDAWICQAMYAKLPKSGAKSEPTSEAEPGTKPKRRRRRRRRSAGEAGSAAPAAPTGESGS